MKEYAVAINTLDESVRGTTTTSIHLEIVEACSIEEAFGKVALSIKGDRKIGAYRAMELVKKSD